ncbi:MAG: bifunctional histidinol-phosphatase/imidazoleglycerol-phosphate dehydratase HisB [Oligoflexales bacterium]|nr:bifunctional histidinol-phosphatase/imidazoleglycerol-phosphate dehydratase HisB [Oligoflexales bacterium]
MAYKKLLFIDRDGTIVKEPDDEQVDQLAKISLVPDVIPCLLELKNANYRFIMVTNQDGLGTDSFPQDDFEQCQNFILDLLESQGITFDDILICPHKPEDACSCRKPATTLVSSYLRQEGVDWSKSYVIGDRESDRTLAKNMGIKGFMLGDEGTSWKSLTREILTTPRLAVLNRKTTETNISLEVNLDSNEPSHIQTGIGMLDHMIEQFAKHSGICLKLKADGDLHIDDHHTVEDVALVLGEGIKRALGDKVGIGRYGFLLPMDEAESQISIDLCGRSYLSFEGALNTQNIGMMNCEMIKHFFYSFSQTLGASIHIQTKGENTHHMVESIFKGLGRSCEQAFAKSSNGQLPSTKGVL